MTPAQSQLNDFVAKFTPPVAAQATACLTRMRQRLPGALVLVYDNYNALALAFSPTERARTPIRFHLIWVRLLCDDDMFVHV